MLVDGEVLCKVYTVGLRRDDSIKNVSQGKINVIGKGLCKRMFTPWSTNKGIIYIHVMGYHTAIQNYFQEIFKDLRMSS